MIRYNEIFGIVRYLYITKLGLRSSNIRYNETYVNNIFTLIILRLRINRMIENCMMEVMTEFKKQ